MWPTFPQTKTSEERGRSSEIIAIIGVFAWAITTYVPMPPPIKGVIIVVALLFCLLVVLRSLGGLEVDL